MSIKKSLRLSLILLTSLPLVFLTVLTYILSYNKYIELSERSASELAQIYAEGFEAQLNVQIAEIESLANVGTIQSLTLESYNGLALGQDSAYYESVVELLQNSSSHMNHTISFYIYDINGYFIASSEQTAQGDWAEYMNMPVSDLKETVILNSPTINQTASCIDLITPIVVKGTIVGLIRAEISSEYFGTFIPDNGTAFIMSSSGEYLFNSQGLSNDKKIESDALLLFEQGKANGFLSSSAFSVENIYGYQKLSNQNWIYIIRQNGARYSEVLSAFPLVLLITLLIILLAALQLSRRLTHKYTDPIFVLKDNMTEAAAGHLDITCDIASDDEFGELSDSFNSMMNIISSNYNQLNESKKILEENEIELKKNYAHIEQLAYHDSLTGLYNRVAFMKYAFEIFHRDGAQFSRHAIFFIDLDNFKNVNDTLGHDYGDLLLKQVADRLNAYITIDDIFARTGGDEFLIFKSDFANKEELDEFAEKLITTVHEPFDLDDEQARVSMSVGVAIFPTDGLSISELIKNADIAMYNAKNSGKNAYRFFNIYMEDDFNKKNELADILTTVLEKNEVYLQYQPQVNVATGEITGYEALMRINSDLAGFIPPSDFIPIAEDTGTINLLGEWALYEACKFNQNLIQNGYSPIRVSVNISTVQFKDSQLIEIIKSIPEKTGMDLKYLEIEITESLLMDSVEHNLHLIEQIKELGISIALDDFGTGYSSFNYLTQIPIDTLKIDKSFIQRIYNNEKDRYIADSIIALAHKMDISVVAEGVEDAEQLKILQEQFCDTLQGYLFSKPLDAEKFIELLENKKQETS